MDCLVIGSNGFAQMGDSAFNRKQKIEMWVLLDYFRHNFPIPQKIKTLAYYSVKTFHNDFGDYLEIVLRYDRSYSILWKILKSNRILKFLMCFGVGFG